jgi:hypothetical protein
MSSPEASAPEAALAERAAGLYDLVKAVLAEGTADRVPEQTVQELLTLAVKLYVARCEGDEFIEPFADDSVTATEVAFTATSMLKAVELEVFELTMWKSFGRI